MIEEKNKAIADMSAQTDTKEEDGVRESMEILINANQNTRDEIHRQMATYGMLQQHMARVGELTRQEDDLNRQLTELERQQDTAEALEHKKMDILQERVNKLFNLVEFNMFNKLMNGNVTTTCECTMHGTPYQDLSNSEKINAGLDIIEAMTRYNDTWAPVFVDNAESVNDVLATESQQILLSVSRDRQLTIIK